MADLSVKAIGVNPGMTLGVTSSGIDGTLWAGVYNLNVRGSDADDLGIEGTVQAFCIDIWDYAPTSAYKAYEAVSLELAPDPGAGPMGIERARYLATLFNRYWTSSLTNLEAAALQAAVWEIVDEGNVNRYAEDPVPASWNVWKYASDKGNFYVNNYQVAMLANSWLGEVRNLGGSDYEQYLALSSSGGYHQAGYQDYAVRVPVPGAVLLGVVGMAVAGVKLRRRDRGGMDTL